MADDWEAEDWEAEGFKPALPAGAAAAAEGELTAGQALLAKATEPDMSKFADEDQEEPEPEPEYHIKPQPKKKPEKRYTKGEEAAAAAAGGGEAALDDPLAERLRRQRLEEEADLRAGVFGDAGLDAAKRLASILPNSVKDYEAYAELLAKTFVAPHAGSKNYKAYVKALLKAALAPLSSEDAKEIENTAGTIRADKVREEKAVAAKKTSKRNVNVGKAGASAGLDDYIYDAPEEDDFDFM